VVGAAAEVTAADLAGLAGEVPAAAALPEIGRLLLHEQEKENVGMRRGLWVAIAALVVIFLAVLLVFGSYVSAKNQMVQKREAVTESWGEVNNQLQRRADLIPNLVETVKGYAKQETTVFGDPHSTIQANGALDGALGRLLVLTENYPDLKSNGNFQRLSDELAGTENRISVARMRYNKNIEDYNTFIGQFPNSIWAGMGGFQRNNDYFQASAGAQTVPKVNF
jgi:LemA protein